MMFELFSRSDLDIDARSCCTSLLLSDNKHIIIIKIVFFASKTAGYIVMCAFARASSGVSMSTSQTIF